MKGNVVMSEQKELCKRKKKHLEINDAVISLNEVSVHAKELL